MLKDDKKNDQWWYAFFAFVGVFGLACWVAVIWVVIHFVCKWW